MENKSILTEANDIIFGDREETYGNPGKNLQNIANYWTNYLNNVGILQQGKEISAENVALMMVLLKIARQSHKGKRDNLVDICGYVALIERIQNESNANSSIQPPLASIKGIES